MVKLCWLECGVFCTLRAPKCTPSCGAWRGCNGRNVRQRCDAMAAVVRVCYTTEVREVAYSSFAPAHTRPAAASNPPIQSSRTSPDRSVRLTTLPGEKTELTAEAASAPANSSASHVSRRWRKGGGPLCSRQHPADPRRGDGSPLRGRRGACAAPQTTTRHRRNPKKKLTIYQVSRRPDHQGRPNHHHPRRAPRRP